MQLTRVYDEPNFKPSEASEASIHIMLAIILHNLSLRFYDKSQFPRHIAQDMAKQADEHYHYALGFFPQLMVQHTLEAMQALVMITNHVREFPLPELGYFVATKTFNRLVQLNYHRSPAAAAAASAGGQPPAWAADKSALEIELRKRVFWSSITILVPAAGRLGRPMPVRFEDFDVEIPLAIDDTQVLAAGAGDSKQGHCSFLVALEGFKVVPIFMELYGFLYAARKTPEEYTSFVRRAEARISAWTRDWHPDFQRQPTDDDIALANGIILRYYAQEFRLVLYHPSLSLTRSVPFNEANLRRCLEATDEMLRTVLVMKRLRVMDGTWNNCAAYLLAMQTTIYGHGQLRAELTPETLQKLRVDMEAWLDILGEVGSLVGKGDSHLSAIALDLPIVQARVPCCKTPCAPKSTPASPSSSATSRPAAAPRRRSSRASAPAAWTPLRTWTCAPPRTAAAARARWATPARKPPPRATACPRTRAAAPPTRRPCATSRPPWRRSGTWPACRASPTCRATAATTRRWTRTRTRSPDRNLNLRMKPSNPKPASLPLPTPLP